jgi:putative cell wall-binding protein/Tol biopolymer transport system component
LATDLSEVTPPYGTSQVYVRDIQTGVTQMISTNGGTPGDRLSRMPSISADGSVVAYVSESTNLAPGASSGLFQILVWSRTTKTNQVASVSSGAAPVVGNGASAGVALSADGNVVAFTSWATNLTAEGTGGAAQVFTHDLTTKDTSMVSLDTNAMTPRGAPWNATAPAISGDGRIVAFSSQAKLTSEPNLGGFQIYVRDRSAGRTELASVNLAGNAGADGNSMSPTMSTSGDLVAFSSTANDLTSRGTAKTESIYLRDRKAGVTTLESIDYTGSIHVGLAIHPALSADGTHLSFESTGRNVVPDGGVGSTIVQAYVRDLTRGLTRLVSRPMSGTGFGNADSTRPVPSHDGALVAFTSAATDLTSETASGIGQVYLRNSLTASRLDRIGGPDRFAVSASVSAASFSPRLNYVFVASGALFPDALSASAAAGFLGAPVLLALKDGIPPAVEAELVRLQPRFIVVVGGTNTISSEVEARLKTFALGGVSRVSGNDRFDVSAALSAFVFRSGSATAYVASGAVFPDALSGSAAAGHVRAPVLLAGQSGIAASVLAELTRLQVTRIVVLGGPNTIAESVVTQLQAIAPTTRIGGADRFAVSAAVSSATFAPNTTEVYVASGAVFPDALSGSAAAIKVGAPVLLVSADSVPEAVAAELDRLKPTRIVVLGGPATVSDAVLAELRRHMAS